MLMATQLLNPPDLGIVFTNSLTWQDHYEMVSSKAYKPLGLLRRVFKDSKCTQARKSLYITLVRLKLLLLFNTVETLSIKGYRVT